MAYPISDYQNWSLSHPKPDHSKVVLIILVVFPKTLLGQGF